MKTKAGTLLISAIAVLAVAGATTVSAKTETVVRKGTLKVRWSKTKTMPKTKGKVRVEKKASKFVRISKDGKVEGLKVGFVEDAVSVRTKSRTELYSVRVVPWFEERERIVEKGTDVRIEANGIRGKATWTSSNPRVATVDERGNVRTKRKGTTTIRVERNGASASMKLVVKGEILTPDSWIESGTGTYLDQRVRTRDGTRTFRTFNQKTYPSYDWLPSGGCATCATTTIARAYGTGEYRSADPTTATILGNGGCKFNFFGDGIMNVLRNAGVRFKMETYGTGDLKRFEKRLKGGTPMLISVRGNGVSYARSSGHSLAVLGMTESGKTIVSDSYIPFFGSLVYAIPTERLFEVMCDDSCSTYSRKEVLVVE